MNLQFNSLAAALAAALKTERDPAVKAWATKLLAAADQPPRENTNKARKPRKAVRK